VWVIDRVAAAAIDAVCAIAAQAELGARTAIVTVAVARVEALLRALVRPLRR